MSIPVTKFRLLHLFPDEKVVDSFISLMEEVYPGESFYAIYGKTDSAQRVKSVGNVRYFKLGSCRFRRFLRDTAAFDRVIFHFVPSDRSFLSLRHPDITGLFWGGDFYEGLLSVKGYNLYYEIDDIWKIKAAGRIPVPLYKVLVFIRNRVNYTREIRLVRRFNRVGLQPCDAKLFKLYFPQFSFKGVSEFSYYPINQLIGTEYLDCECKGKTIWVNNSSALSGNHYSVFRRLSSFSPDIKIVSPISYGEKSWAQYVERIGHELLGNRFIPLKEFLPIKEYYSLFLDANAFIFGHLRQCAYGNVLVALYFGAKCFFYKANPLYGELIERGFHVFSIEDDLTEAFVLTPLADDCRKLNREKVFAKNTREVLLDQIKESFKS